MSDLIDRQAANDAMAQLQAGAYSKAEFMAINKAWKRIKKLKPVKPKKGKWIDTGSNEEWYAREYRCSECGGTMLGEANFCPNCGADMREETT